MTSLLPSPKWCLENPLRSLLSLFYVYKTLILLVAIGTPGPGYDTSTHLYEDQISGDAKTCGLIAWFLKIVAKNLTRWDALFFTRVADKGYVVEQYWAFGWGWTSLISWFSTDLRATLLGEYAFIESFTGIVIAHFMHALSVFALYKLAKEVFTGPSGHKLAYVAACLQIIQPGGIFLSAPYAESTTAALSFTSLVFFVKSFPLFGQSSVVHDFSLLVAGIGLGLATTVRSNALLYGMLFAEEAGRLVWSLRDGVTYRKIRRGVCTGLGGLSIAAGFIYPQWIAYNQFCVPDREARPWCMRTIPGIYAFVQVRYWDLGFLHYWRVNHIPLFLLAAPMITILFSSALWTFRLSTRSTTAPTYKVDHFKTTDKETAMANRTIHLLQSMAAPQVILAAMSITNYHVQIITRIGSAYPVCMFWLSYHLIGYAKSDEERLKETMRPGPKGEGAEIDGRVKRNGKWVKKTMKERFMDNWPRITVCYMMMYGLIQTVLYASFLPPA